MNKSISRPTSSTSVLELTKISIVVSLYVVVTAWLAVFSFGMIQLRLSEMFNYLALYHKRYVIAVTLGVIFANLMSPTGLLDVPIGGVSTFLVLVLCRYITRNIKHHGTKLAVTAMIFALSMFTVAGQLTIMLDLPFFYTWLSVGAGELLSMAIGGIFIYFLSKKD
ncbi:QueT transporter family protein [Virgibacillus halophilus]|uniref:QueT transporter family protein n=1 Tax=Tigheibacillus halophilus TaxID=361280 RepID=A0ABU5C629_9BACI|nr:QueT transporter family protein [Virgibacillus halophilus]